MGVGTIFRKMQVPFTDEHTSTRYARLPALAMDAEDDDDGAPVTVMRELVCKDCAGHTWTVAPDESTDDIVRDDGVRLRLPCIWTADVHIAISATHAAVIDTNVSGMVLAWCLGAAQMPPARAISFGTTPVVDIDLHGPVLTTFAYDGRVHSVDLGAKELSPTQIANYSNRRLACGFVLPDGRTSLAMTPECCILQLDSSEGVVEESAVGGCSLLAAGALNALGADGLTAWNSVHFLSSGEDGGPLVTSSAHRGTESLAPISAMCIVQRALIAPGQDAGARPARICRMGTQHIGAVVPTLYGWSLVTTDADCPSLLRLGHSAVFNIIGGVLEVV